MKWIAVACVVLVIWAGAIVILINRVTESYRTQTVLFQDMDEARDFQKQCLNKPDSHVTVTDMVTGVQITCRWFE